jgi:hypothetical protein
MELTTLEPGCDPELTCCPHCRGKSAEILYEKESDLIFSGAAIPLRDRRGHTLITQLHLQECIWCTGDCFILELASVSDPNVAQDWIVKYQWMADSNEVHPYTITYRGPDTAIPHQWLVIKVKTPHGNLWRHFYGPYILEKDSSIDNWLSFSGDDLMGLEPFGLISKVWPLVSLLPG